MGLPPSSARPAAAHLACQVSLVGYGALQAVTPHLSRAPMRPRRPALLIEIAGIDGSGKSTLCTKIAECCRGLDIDTEVVVSCPPSDSWFLECSRQLAETGHCDRPLRDMLTLAIAARREHMNSAWMPMLRQGKTLLADRHILSLISFYAFLGYREAPDLLVASADVLPQRVIVLDTPPSVCVERLIERGASRDYHEQSIARLATYRTTLLETIAGCVVPALFIPAGEASITGCLKWLDLT